MKRQQKLLLLFFILLFALFYASTFNTPLLNLKEKFESHQLASKERDRSFIDLFHSKRANGFAVVSQNVNSYIQSCCKDKDASIKLLQDYGFDLVIINDKKKVKALNKHWGKSENFYEEFIFAKRRSKFFNLFTSYQITLFIKGKEVKDVYAVIDHTFF